MSDIIKILHFRFDFDHLIEKRSNILNRQILFKNRITVDDQIPNKIRFRTNEGILAHLIDIVAQCILKRAFIV